MLNILTESYNVSFFACCSIEFSSSKDEKHLLSFCVLPPAGYLNLTLSLHNVHEDALTVPESSGEQWWMTNREVWRSGQTLRTLRPRRGRPHAAWIITPPESRPLLPSWFMVSGRPNHPMEASHPAQTEGHPSGFVKPSYPTVLYILLICVGLFSFNLAPWFNRNIKGRTQYSTVKYCTAGPPDRRN